MSTILCAGSLPKPVEVGQVIVIGGRLRSNAWRFEINLATGQTYNDEIALHLSWRRDDCIIVRNTKICGEWGPEERATNRNRITTDLAIEQGEDFEISFLVHDQYFKVSINGLPYCTYNHRMPFDEIKAISVARDVEFIRCISQRSVTPSVYPAVTFPTNDEVTFAQDFPSSPQLGHIIVITAIPRGAGQFVINLHQGSDKMLALQITVDFNECSIKLNDRHENGYCGSSQIWDSFPFKLKEKFCLAIEFEEVQFDVSVDGQHLGKFKFTNNNVYGTVSSLTIRNFCCMNLAISNVGHFEKSSKCLRALDELSSLSIR